MMSTERGTKRTGLSAADKEGIPEELRRRSSRGSKGKIPERLGEAIEEEAVTSDAVSVAAPTKKRKATRRQKAYVVPNFTQADATIVKPPWDPAYNRGLESEFGSRPRCTAEYRTSGITVVNHDFPLCKTKTLTHSGVVYGLNWSNDGSMLASCSSLGSIQIYDTNTWEIIKVLRDPDESNVEEFYTIQFTPDDTKIFAAGKLKDREVWDDVDDDNQILPCPIKLFDVVTGEVIIKMEGHEEEVLDVKAVLFRNENYVLSASQDGYLFKWCMSENWGTCTRVVKIDPVTSCMLMKTSFLPGCGNKYFIAAADEGVKVYDFEAGVVLQAIEGLYSSYCDCVAVVDIPSMGLGEGMEYFFLSRGVERMKSHQKVEKFVSELRLHRLTAPKVFTDQSKSPVFKHEVISTYTDARYHANVWPLALAASGSYVLAPAIDNSFFGWNLTSGQLVCICVDDKASFTGAVRDIRFHPSRPCVVAGGDTSHIFVYEQDRSGEEAESWYSSQVGPQFGLKRAQTELERLIELTPNLTVKRQLRCLMEENAKIINGDDGESGAA